ncbi:MAG: uracil-DNA glycosylase [Hornefia sp.]|nr:uracil-DNA glycosylase [Hornefia sp.]
MVNIGNSWDEILREEFKKEYYLKLREFLKKEYATRRIYPDMYSIFNAFKATPYENVKCLILGQDPYHGEGQAHGLSFSVPEGVPQPPSLQNIFKELAGDMEQAYGKKLQIPKSGCLEKWAEEGVMLLNTSLTVRAGQAGSHRNKGWEILTDRVIELLNQREKPMVFILWGNPARAKKKLIDGRKHCIIEGVHPSPLSARGGFFGGRYFSRTNEFLKAKGQKPIDWTL